MKSPYEQGYFDGFSGSFDGWAGSGRRSLLDIPGDKADYEDGYCDGASDKSSETIQKEHEINDIYRNREFDAERMADRYLDWQETDEHGRNCSNYERQWQQEDDWHNHENEKTK